MGRNRIVSLGGRRGILECSFAGRLQSWGVGVWVCGGVGCRRLGNIGKFRGRRVLGGALLLAGQHQKAFLLVCAFWRWWGVRFAGGWGFASQEVGGSLRGWGFVSWKGKCFKV